MRNTFCLQSVSSFRQINSSPINNSTSKNLWTFAKDSRFKNPVVYCDNIYERHSSLKNKGSGIGYGKKSDFTKDLTCSPGSSKYNLKTIFDKNRSSKKGFSMYVGRQEIPSRGYIPLQPMKFPSPNRYNNLRVNPASSYSMRKKTKVLDKTMSIESQNDNPGAGRYQNPQSLSPKGKYFVSKHKGTGSTLFNPKKSVRFFEFKNKVPGPGKYETIDKLSNSGKYIPSTSVGFGKRYFDKEKRVSEFEFKAKKNYNPGPGTYRTPSEFGQYDGDVYNHSMQMYKTTLSNSKSSFRKMNRSSLSSRKK